MLTSRLFLFVCFSPVQSRKETGAPFCKIGIGTLPSLRSVGDVRVRRRLGREAEFFQVGSDETVKSSDQFTRLKHG